MRWDLELPQVEESFDALLQVLQSTDEKGYQTETILKGRSTLFTVDEKTLTVKWNAKRERPGTSEETCLILRNVHKAPGNL
jgi:hypothetical protein